MTVTPSPALTLPRPTPVLRQTLSSPKSPGSQKTSETPSSFMVSLWGADRECAKLGHSYSLLPWGTYEPRSEYIHSQVVSKPAMEIYPSLVSPWPAPE